MRSREHPKRSPSEVMVPSSHRAGNYPPADRQCIDDSGGREASPDDRSAHLSGYENLFQYTIDNGTMKYCMRLDVF